MWCLFVCFVFVFLCFPFVLLIFSVKFEVFYWTSTTYFLLFQCLLLQWELILQGVLMVLALAPHWCFIFNYFKFICFRIYLNFLNCTRCALSQIYHTLNTSLTLITHINNHLNWIGLGWICISYGIFCHHHVHYPHRYETPSQQNLVLVDILF